MDKDFEFFIDKPQQVTVYEKKLSENCGVYFDVEDFEQIIEYYLFSNMIDKAMYAAELAINLHPASAELKLKVAKLLASSNDEKGALNVIAELERSEPDNVELCLTKGAIFSQLEKYEKAIEEYTKVLDVVDDPDYICCSIAFEYENLGNYNKTIEYLRKALEYNPNNYVAMYEAAYCFDLLSLNEESISFFEKHIDKHPYSKEAWFNLGTSFINAALFEKAIEAFDYCLAIDDKHKPAYIHKAIAYSNMNDYYPAIENFKKSIEDDEIEQPMILYYIAECYEKLEDYANGIKYYKKAIQNDSENTEAWIGLGVCEFEAGNIKNALKSMHKAVIIDPENVSNLCLLANTYLENSDKENCIIFYEQALFFDNEDIDTWSEYIEAMIHFKDYQEAINLIVRGTDTIDSSEHNSNTIFNYFMAVCLYKQGRQCKADFFLEEALTEDHKHNSFHILEKYPELFKIESFLELIEAYGPTK